MTPEQIITQFNRGVSVKSISEVVYSRMKSDYAQIRTHAANEPAPTKREAQSYVERVIFKARFKVGEKKGKL
jgi:hypothetical protein